MKAKNIHDAPTYILKDMHKVLVNPGETIHINDHDVRHSGDALRFFLLFEADEPVLRHANDGDVIDSFEQDANIVEDVKMDPAVDVSVDKPADINPVDINHADSNTNSNVDIVKADNLQEVVEEVEKPTLKGRSK